MFIRTKIIKSNRYYYLVENSRLDGKHRQRVIEYLGNRDLALATLKASNYPGKDKLLARVRGS